MEGRKGAKAFFGKNYSRSNTGTNTTTSKTTVQTSQSIRAQEYGHLHILRTLNGFA
jgi:hypothetical protein